MSDKLRHAISNLPAEKRVIVRYYWQLVAQMNSTNCEDESILDAYIAVQDKYPKLKDWFDLDKWC